MLHEWEIRPNEFVPSELDKRGIMIRSFAARVGVADNMLVLDRAAAVRLWKKLSERAGPTRLERSVWLYINEGTVYFRWIMYPVAATTTTTLTGL